MDITTLLVPVTVIIGIVNGVKLASPSVVGFISFLLALGLGLLFGAIGMFGLTIETGIVAALVSSGLYKLAQVV
jgi:hypothetical protein